METHSDNSAWRRLFALLRSAEAGSAVTREFPLESPSSEAELRSTKRLSVIDALRSPDVSVSDEQHDCGTELATAIEGLFDQLSVFERLHRCPIVAITGMLNAGKSSLLATYLSTDGRDRVLRGLNNCAGTHRFALWLPDLWRREPELLETLLNYLTNLFGHPPEHLSDDPHEAAEQYNGRVLQQHLAVVPATENFESPKSNGDQTIPATRATPLSIPLLAYDVGLDALKIGLVDCPDIQTGFLNGGTPVGALGDNQVVGSDDRSEGRQLVQERQHQLARLSRLCSAFIVVSKLGNLHDTDLQRVLTTLRDAMPGIPRLLAVNKVKARYAPTVVAEQSQGLCARFGIEHVYVAYNFHSSLAASRLPPSPPEIQDSGGAGDLPIFFEVFSTPQSSAKMAPQARTEPLEVNDHATTELNYLLHLSQQLDPGTLARESTRSILLQLRSQTDSALAWLTRNLDQQSTQVADAWAAVAGACYEFMAERDENGSTSGLRLQASPAIVAQMADSLSRTAPMWMRASLRVDRTVRHMHQAVANSAARLKILQSASQSVTQFAKRFQRGEGAQVVTPERLAESIRGHDVHEAFFRVPLERLVADCGAAIKRFAAEDQTQLNEQELDEWSRQVWQTMPLKSKLWKGTQPLAVLTAPLLAAILVPFDGGGTAVLVFASAKELLAAAGVAAVLGTTTGGNAALDLVQQETPWRQLSDLFAIVCDSVGIDRPVKHQLPTAGVAPRTSIGQEKRRLLESTLPAKPTYKIAAIQRWRLPPELVQDLRRTLTQLG